MENIRLDNSVQYLKGVGPKMSELLNKLGIYSVKDLLEYYPRTYEDRTKLTTIDNFQKDQNVLFLGTLVKPVTMVYARKKKILSTVVTDESGAIALLTWFNQVYIKESVLKCTSRPILLSYRFFYNPLQILPKLILQIIPPQSILHHGF